MKWTEIRYKCACMTREVSFNMPERGVQESIEEFMTRLQQALGDDHRKRSPFCLSNKVEYAKLPVHNDVIGGAEGGQA